jgi:site-specific recombinase XerC
LAAGTINQRLAAVRRLAYEAADSGLLSPELATGIRRVKGVKQLGSRAGNWLTHDEARTLLQAADGEGLRSVRDLAMISVLLGCGLRRAELSGLEVDDLQIRQGHWAIIDLVGKGGHVRTVPMPAWVKAAVDRWTSAAKVTTGRIFRAVSRHGTPLQGRLIGVCLPSHSSERVVGILRAIAASLLDTYGFVVFATRPRASYVVSTLFPFVLVSVTLPNPS